MEWCDGSGKERHASTGVTHYSNIVYIEAELNQNRPDRRGILLFEKQEIEQRAGALFDAGEECSLHMT